MVRKKITVEITQATESIRRMRGTSEPHLMRCADGELYVVKFLNNPQHPRILINELLCAQLARRLGLPVPPPTLVEVSPELIQHNQSLYPTFLISTSDMSSSGFPVVNDRILSLPQH